jgi:hypothetical protein
MEGGGGRWREEGGALFLVSTAMRSALGVWSTQKSFTPAFSASGTGDDGCIECALHTAQRVREEMEEMEKEEEMEEMKGGVPSTAPSQREMRSASEATCSSCFTLPFLPLPALAAACAPAFTSRSNRSHRSPARLPGEEGEEEGDGEASSALLPRRPSSSALSTAYTTMRASELPTHAVRSDMTHQ